MCWIFVSRGNRSSLGRGGVIVALGKCDGGSPNENAPTEPGRLGDTLRRGPEFGIFVGDKIDGGRIPPQPESSNLHRSKSAADGIPNGGAAIPNPRRPANAEISVFWFDQPEPVNFKLDRPADEIQALSESTDNLAPWN